PRSDPSTCHRNWTPHPTLGMASPVSEAFPRDRLPMPRIAAETPSRLPKASSGLGAGLRTPPTAGPQVSTHQATWRIRSHRREFDGPPNKTLRWSDSRGIDRALGASTLLFNALWLNLNRAFTYCGCPTTGNAVLAWCRAVTGGGSRDRAGADPDRAEVAE